DDAGLPQLSGLLAPDAARPFWGEPARAVDIVRYEPECRATVRYTGARGDALYAKTFSDDRGAAIHARFAWFWERSHQDARAPLVARPLQYAAAGRTLWQESACGTPLADWIARGASGAWVLPLAHAIATVHAAPHHLAGPATQDTAHWLLEAARRRQKIARALPPLAGRADATLAAIDQSAASLPPYAPVTIHGDFHVDQAWFDGERIVLFDFDEFALGDPMQDLAAFLVRLPGEELLQPLANPWVAAYAQIAPQHFCGVRLAWHLAVQQLLRASRAFIFQLPGWQEELERRLAGAQALALQAQEECAA
ncbi:aminoglycoside phosphotransferase/kinase family protein, partial [Ramlibacter alkalitolerans]